MKERLIKVTIFYIVGLLLVVTATNAHTSTSTL